MDWYDYNETDVSSIGFTPPQKSTFALPKISTPRSYIESKDDQLKELSEKLTTLQLTIQRLEEKFEDFEKEKLSKYNQLKKISEIVELLQSRTGQYTRTNNVLGDKINSNQLKIIELNAKDCSKNDELMDFSGKIASFELHLRQTEEKFSKLLNKETILKQQQQQFIKLSVENECMQKRNDAHTDAIQELNERIRSIDSRLTTNTIDLEKNIAMKNDEFVYLTGKMNNFESHIQKAQEDNRKLNRKLHFMSGINTVLIIASTFLLVKQII